MPDGSNTHNTIIKYSIKYNGKKSTKNLKNTTKAT